MRAVKFGLIPANALTAEAVGKQSAYPVVRRLIKNVNVKENKASRSTIAAHSVICSAVAGFWKIIYSDLFGDKVVTNG